MKPNFARLGFAGLLLSLTACTSPGPAIVDEAEFDLSRYRKVMVDPVTVNFDDDWQPVETGSHMEASISETQRVRDRLAALFDAEFRARLVANSDLQLVDEPGAGVLRIRPELADVYLNAPVLPSALSSDIYTRSIGSLELNVEFRDSESGELLLLLNDGVHGDDQRLMRRASPMSTQARLARIFRNWADLVRRGILRTP